MGDAKRGEGEMPFDGMKGLRDDAKEGKEEGFGASVQVGTRGSTGPRHRGAGEGGGAGVRRKGLRSRAGGGAEEEDDACGGAHVRRVE